MGSSRTKGPIRILLWAPFGSGNHYWGPGKSAYNLYKGNESKVSFCIDLAHGYAENEDYRLFSAQYFVGDLKRGDILSTIGFLIKSYLWIRKNYSKYDVVHVLSAFHYSFLPALWFESFGVPTYVKMTAENAGFSGSGRVSKFFGLDSYRRRKSSLVTGYIAISEAIAKELKSIGIDTSKIHKIPNGVNTRNYHPVDKTTQKKIRLELGLKDIDTILFVGGVSARKRTFNIVEAMKKFVDQEIQLLIIGPTRENGEKIEDEIIKFVSENNIADKIIRIDHTKEMGRYYQASDVFVLPSRNEGMSNALLEALSSGLPSIVTPVSGSVDLVSDEINGFVINGTSSTIASAIERALSGDYLSYSKNARHTIEEGFTNTIVFTSHMNLFNRHGRV